MLRMWDQRPGYNKYVMVLGHEKVLTVSSDNHICQQRLPMCRKHLGLRVCTCLHVNSLGIRQDVCA